MAAYDFDLVCLGSGPAGQRAAVQAAKLGKRAAIVEKQRVGGVCVETGTIPSKTFREAVLSFAAASTLLASGVLRPEIRPTAEQLLARVNDVIRREGLVVEDQLRRNGVAMIRGAASFLDAHTILVQADDSARRVTGEQILVAVGTTPGITEATGALDGVAITSDQIMALRRLPRTMAVVGAGIIGIEYASMFAALGVEVTVVDRRERPLEFLDHEIVDELVHQMRKRRVTFRLGEAVASVAVQDGVGAVPRAVLALNPASALLPSWPSSRSVVRAPPTP